MSDMHDDNDPLSPDTSGTGDRIGDALNAYADTIAPADAWVGITERLEGRRSVWAFITQNPLTIGALAAAIVLVALLALSSLGDGSSSGGPLPVAGNGQGADARDSRLVAGTPDGALVELGLSEINEAAEDGTETHRTEVAESTLVTADAWPAAQRPDGSPEDEALLTELAATDDGLTVLQTRPDNAGATCAGSELTAGWDIWQVDLADGATPVRLLDGDGTPSRLPALSADGASLAYVTTSNGRRCDEALVVNVTEFETGTILATQSLPAGVVPEQLYWTPDDALYVMLPQSTDELTPLLPVRINEPEAISGAIDFSGASFTSSAQVVVAADREGESLRTTFSYRDVDGENLNLQVLRGNFGSDVIGTELPYYELPLTDVDSGPTSLTADGDGGSWITVGRGTPGWPVADWNSYELYARRFATSELIGTGYLAVASLENNTPSSEPTTPPVAAADPGRDRDRLQPENWRDVTGFAYVTPAGEIYQGSRFGAERRLLATLDFATVDGVTTTGMAVTPDEETLYVSQWFADGGGCEATLWSIEYPAAAEVPDATLVEAGNGIYPAVSPDGTKLAYFTGSARPDADSGCIFDLVVEDLVTGDTTTWDGTSIFNGQDLWPSPVGLAWSPDNRTVAFSASGTVAFIASSYEGPTTYTFDTDTPTSELTATRLDIALPGGESQWAVTDYLDTGELALLASCDEGCSGPTRTLLAVDPADTSSTRVLAELPATARSAQVDRDGENILYTEFLCGTSTECDSTLLWTDGTTEAVPAATDVDVFTWVP